MSTVMPCMAEIPATKILEMRLREVNRLLDENNKLLSDGCNVITRSKILQTIKELSEQRKSLLTEARNERCKIISDIIADLKTYGVDIEFIRELGLLKFNQPVSDIQKMIKITNSEKIMHSLISMFMNDDVVCVNNEPKYKPKNDKCHLETYEQLHRIKIGMWLESKKDKLIADADSLEQIIKSYNETGYLGDDDITSLIKMNAGLFND